MSYHILCWSGGFDSTAVLIGATRWLAEAPYINDQYYVVSCDLDATANRVEDKKARDDIKKFILESNVISPQVKDRISFYETKLEWNSPPNACSAQAPIWGFLIGNSVPVTEDPVFISFGYIKGDDFWHNRENFEKIVRSIVDWNFKWKDIKPNLSFYYPVEWKTKRDLLIDYVNHREVFDLISWAGDTATVKLKEKDELLDIFNLMQNAIYVAKPITGEEKKKEECAKMMVTESAMVQIDVKSIQDEFNFTI